MTTMGDVQQSNTGQNVVFRDLQRRENVVINSVFFKTFYHSLPNIA